MKKIIFKLGLAFTALSASINAQIVECTTLSSVLDVADHNSLILFNVTDTLYTSSNTVGTFEWREYVSEKVREWEPNAQKAEEILVRIKRDTMTVMPKMLVDKYAAEVIKTLHANKIATMGFTSKNRATPWLPNFDEVVKNHLKNLGIDFTENDYFAVTLEDNGINPHVSGGVIFTEGRSKIEALKSVLRSIQPQVKKVVLVDDMLILQELDAALIQEGIDFIGLRFNGSDSIKEYRDVKLGIIQFEKFLSDGAIMSDEEAESLLKDAPNLDYDAVLKTLVETYYTSS